VFLRLASGRLLSGATFMAGVVAAELNVKTDDDDVEVESVGAAG
jgi:hypothetical protein